jgi:hypothetical protein
VSKPLTPVVTNAAADTHNLWGHIFQTCSKHQIMPLLFRPITSSDASRPREVSVSKPLTPIINKAAARQTDTGAECLSVQFVQRGVSAAADANN